MPAHERDPADYEKDGHSVPNIQTDCYSTGIGQITLHFDGEGHTLYLEEAVDEQPVYVNNYSGAGTVVTADGFYRLGFYVE